MRSPYEDSLTDYRHGVVGHHPLGREEAGYEVELRVELRVELKVELTREEHKENPLSYQHLDHWRCTARLAFVCGLDFS